MARLALLVLLLANLGYFAWSHGWLREAGLAPDRQREPQRIAQQIRPEALQIVGRGSDAVAESEPTTAATANAPAAAECMQAGPFDEAEAATLETALERILTRDRWRLEPTRREARRRLVLDVDAVLREKLPALEAALAGKPLEPCDAALPR